MKFKGLTLLMASCFVLTGCNILKKLKDLIPDGDYIDDDDYGEGVDEETAMQYLAKAVLAYNSRNYQIDYRQTTNGVPIQTIYLIDGYKAKQGTDYFDYTNADTLGTGDNYIYDEDSESYTKSTVSLDTEPGYSRFITRGKIQVTDFGYDRETNEYTMNETGRAKFDFTSCTMKIKMNGTEVQKLHFEAASDVTTGGMAADTSLIADVTRFGDILVELPTQYA